MGDIKIDCAILVGHEVKPIDTSTKEGSIEWGAWYENKANRIVAQTIIHRRLKIGVSTVFLGINHDFFGFRSLWFETMIFGSSLNEYQVRYETWDEAVKGHADAVHRARQARWIRNPDSRHKLWKQFRKLLNPKRPRRY